MLKKKVLLLTYGNKDHASSRIRGVNHFDRLKNKFQTTWIPRTGTQPNNSSLSKMVFALQKRINWLRQLLAIVFNKYDIVFIQVMFLPEHWLRLLKKKNTLICFDFDDAVYVYSPEKFELMMRYANKVIVSTPLLMEHIAANNTNCEIIFSPVDTEKILPAFNPQTLFTIGWIGSTWTQFYLAELTTVFKNLSEKFRFKFLLVGGQTEIRDVDVECITWSEQNELDALSRIDVGVMPLKNDEWSKMKGGYKLYLYMAAGKPVVASPYGINQSIVKNGVNGYIAETEEEWKNALELLEGDIALRKRLGQTARKDAEEKYSYDVCTKQLLDFLNS